MAEIWLALLLVATLGSVDPGESAITVDEVKAAWSTFKPTLVLQEITTCDSSPSSCDSTQVGTAAGDAATDLPALCQKLKDYLNCAGQCTSLDTSTLDNLCDTGNTGAAATVDEVKAAWGTFKPTQVPQEISTCDSSPSSCDSTQVDTAAGDAATDLPALCQEIDTYSTCAEQGCDQILTAPQKQALQDMVDQCKTAKLETALAVITGKCSECSTEAGAVDTATGLDDKCQASKVYIDCIEQPTSCTTVTEDEKNAVKTLCPDTFMTSTSTKPPTDTTAKTTGTTKNPADVVKSAWANFKQNSLGITACDAKCPSSDADTGVGSSDLTTICKTVLDYTGCAVANCNMSKTDPLLVALTEPCPDGDDDGCSILQVSILALMLSLLLSII